MSKAIAVTALLSIISTTAACDWVLGEPGCPPGQVLNEELQSCVTPPSCDGGIVDAHNQCVLTGAGDAGVDGIVDAGRRSRSFPQRATDAGTFKTDGAATGTGGTAGAAGSAGSAGEPSHETTDAGTTADAASGSAGRVAMPNEPVCGNGKREGDELCDGADCPTECMKTSPCLAVQLEGDADECNARCIEAEINTCTAGDTCCPSGCDHGSDADCSPSCGDGVLTVPETCELGSTSHPCPTARECDDRNPCTEDRLTGGQCTAECSYTSLTRMPVDCDDGDPCTDDSLVESATACTYDCVSSTPRRPTGSCADSDPCTDDTPVMSRTRCAYECPHTRMQPTQANCDDGNACTTDTSMLSSTACAYTCSNTLIGTGVLNACGGCTTLTNRPGTACTAGSGACQGNGEYECDGPNATRCNATAKVVAEICDGRDNDCDGETDETVLNACGNCNVLNEACDNSDNDCDGKVDEEGSNNVEWCAPHEYCSRGDCRPRACTTDSDCAPERWCSIGNGCIPR